MCVRTLLTGWDERRGGHPGLDNGGALGISLGGLQVSGIVIGVSGDAKSGTLTHFTTLLK